MQDITSEALLTVKTKIEACLHIFNEVIDFHQYGERMIGGVFSHSGKFLGT